MTPLAAPPEPLGLARLPTPIGPALAAVDGAGRLCGFNWEDRTDSLLASLKRGWGQSAIGGEVPAPRPISEAVAAYFAGEFGALDQIDCAWRGTPFQGRIWSALRRIPAGRTTSYAALAGEIGAPRAVRAAGAANGANPISLVVPCHRVIGTNGSLTGYGGGLERKRWLLAHEGARVA
jgi:methylated-DNA-[protein]-cysteine S-methyltransferase